MSNPPKSFVWYELMTTDMDAAEAFYRAVIGWDAKALDGVDARYSILSAGGRPVAGLMTLPAGVREAGRPPAWVGYIGVDDVDAATDGLRKAGGAVHRAPADIPDVGRFSVVADPQGAMFMLFTPSGGEESPASPMAPGHIGWRELYATEWSSAFDFYAGQFGWTKGEAMDMGPMGTYQIFEIGGAMAGGMMNKPAAMPSPAWQFTFNVSGIDAAAARVADGGGRVLSGPMEVPGGMWAVECADPQGARFGLVAPGR